MNIEKLREFFHYDPLEGVITWGKNKPPKGKKGEPAGYVGTQGYLVTSLEGVPLPLTKLAWALHHGCWPGEEVMLRDGDKLNLRSTNLLLRSEAKKKGPLTVERVRELLNYDPQTGAFSWKPSPGRVRAEGEAGCMAETPTGLRRVLQIDGHRVAAARLAFSIIEGRILKRSEWVDHKDGDTTNDRWDNLRIATPQQNASNQGGKPPRSGGLPRGVEEFKRAGGPSDYGYALMYRGTRYRLRGFLTAEAAHASYKAKHLELHGEFSVYASR